MSQGRTNMIFEQEINEIKNHINKIYRLLEDAIYTPDSENAHEANERFEERILSMKEQHELAKQEQNNHIMSKPEIIL